MGLESLEEFLDNLSVTGIKNQTNRIIWLVFYQLNIEKKNMSQKKT